MVFDRSMSSMRSMRSIMRCSCSLQLQKEMRRYDNDAFSLFAPASATTVGYWSYLWRCNGRYSYLSFACSRLRRVNVGQEKIWEHDESLEKVNVVSDESTAKN